MGILKTCGYMDTGYSRVVDCTVCTMYPLKIQICTYEAFEIKVRQNVRHFLNVESQAVKIVLHIRTIVYSVYTLAD